MPEVMLRTVTGPIRAAAVTGAILPHEHLRTDMRWAVGIDSDPHRWLDEERTVTEELRAMRQYDQVGLIVDLTCVGMGRDAASLARIAAGSRVPVVAATGLFAEPFTHTGDTSAEELTRRLMGEISSGLDGTGVFPGVIGEVGVWGEEPTPAEERALVAAARASLASRLPVATYGQNPMGLLEILLGEGLPAGRVSVGYGDGDIGSARKIAESGAFVSLGSVRHGPEQAARLALALIEDGLGAQLLLSSGINRVSQLQRYDGPGYAHLFHAVLPRLHEAGAGEETIRMITHENPMRWLTAG
ncbi:aryldialkylphosphatase [Nonomuraea sp. NBC_01738]|uniref:phosphotriesterase family protein n=1 Tax=Nonomuraea sp. NBC_01738 TaxID=2976003 RepID=UPI002E0EB452|nr:aryldialkylphosphatase [Nonomuraea sp. NBC_01738]